MMGNARPRPVGTRGRRGDGWGPCACPRGMMIPFPEGTTRTEETLRTHSEHYRIQLPDGYILHESFDRARELSFLEYLPE